MNISDELGKLHELLLRGALSDEEFAQAQAALLSGAAPTRKSWPSACTWSATTTSRGKRISVSA